MTGIASKCEKCGKTIAVSPNGSFTAWLFRRADCNCELAALRLQTPENDQRVLSNSLISAKPPSDLIGQIIAGRYEVLEQVGLGGMGAVFKVIDRDSSATLALKVLGNLSNENESLAHRLALETRIISSLTHPHIVALRNSGQLQNGSPFFVMDFVSGESLDSLFHHSASLPEARLINIFTQIADALNYAHEMGVVHRDLKPSNLLLATDQAGKDTIKIIDFGIAKLTKADGNNLKKLTQTGELIGSPLYMSPEQCRGEEVDGRSDIYSLGCIMYEAIANEPPFDGENPVRILMKKISQAPLPSSKLNTVSGDFKKLVLRCLAMHPDERYQDARALVDDLKRLSVGKRISSLKLNWTPRRSRRLSITLGALVGGSCLAVAGFYHFDFGDLTPDRPEIVEGKTLDVLDRNVERHPNDPKVYYQRAVFHSKRTENDSAIRDLTKAIDLDPDYAQAYLGRSSLFVITKQFQRSLADSERAISLYPRWSNAYARRASDERSMELYPQSIEDAEHSLSIKWGCLAFGTLAADYDILGKRRLALTAALKQLEVASSAPKGEDYVPSQYRACADIAQIYMQAHELDKAKEYLHRALALYPKFSRAWANLAIISASQNDMHEAMRCFKRACAFELSPGMAACAAGDLYAAAGNWKDAAENYNTAASQASSNASFFLKRAAAESFRGNLNNAEMDLKNALMMEPNSPLFNSNLSVIEERLGKPKEADLYLSKAFAEAPELPSNYLARAKIAFYGGKHYDAVVDCNRLISQDNYLADAYVTRGAALAQLGLSIEAAKDAAVAKRFGWKEPEYQSQKNDFPTHSTANDDITILRPPIVTLESESSVTWPSPKISDPQKWAIACGALWTGSLEKEGLTSYDSLEAWEASPDGIKMAKQTLLRKPLEVSSKQSFVKYVQGLKAQALKRENRGNVSSYIHLIGICRLSYLVGYTTANEAWQEIMPAAQELQRQFHTWTELANAYRSDVEASSGTNEKYKTDCERTINQFLSDPNSPSKTLPYHLSLRQISQE